MTDEYALDEYAGFCSACIQCVTGSWILIPWDIPRSWFPAALHVKLNLWAGKSAI